MERIPSVAGRLDLDFGFVLPLAFSIPRRVMPQMTDDRERAFAGKSVKLELVEFLNPDENHVIGEEMIRRSFTKTNPAGNRAFEYLANHYPQPIVWKCQQFMLVFPGTVLLGEGNRRYVQILDFSCGPWYIRGAWLDGIFGSRFRVVGFGK